MAVKENGRLDATKTDPLPAIRLPTSTEVEYEVEEILDHRRIDEQVHYLVWWKEESKENASWEPASDVGGPEGGGLYRCFCGKGEWAEVPIEEADEGLREWLEENQYGDMVSQFKTLEAHRKPPPDDESDDEDGDDDED
uniref:Chromo domain-containing protein n=1 Tax=Chromera velia CCMP2878 TaxID=1169474 RepID=A0A0G4H209_9ALVE|eukprot:Cvel_24374.t1-p1 / transcript=Cvel_24374.t1 / gene=Cvel_24374 / organism=Chromera_velia_CCMP2878 / gene_product=hypothetical protein / transcript_product=hypothetical protein / location=Cvel_scaffold2626:968-4552(+) / protein_length=138 / sequence_SO=supercontig / SO=protein_coding / is_pseudo=false